MALKGSWVTVDPILRVQNKMKFAPPGDALRYLGVNIDPWQGKNEGRILGDRLLRAARKIMTYPLKPSQKLVIISSHLIPRFLYTMVANPPSKTLLEGLDGSIRQLVREILHLPAQLTSSFFYTRCRDGGLGFPKLGNIIPLAALRLAVRLESNEYPVVQAVVNGQDYRDKVVKRANVMSLQCPCNLNAISKVKLDLKEKERVQWLDCGWQGKAAPSFFNDRIGNAFLFDRSLLTSRLFIEAIKIITNTAACRVVEKIYQPELDPMCRRCGTLPETLGHIVGQCVANKNPRMRRHNQLVSKVFDRLANIKEAEIYKEHPFTTKDNEILKPD